MVDNAKVATETKAYQKIPIITNFINEDGVDRMNAEIENNYRQIKLDAKMIVERELDRIKKDYSLKHLIKD